MDSGTLATINYSPEIAFSNSARVAQAVGCSGDSPDANAQLACLRAVPLKVLLDASLAVGNAVAPPLGVAAFRPVIDGDFIPDQPSRLVLEGSFVKSEITRSKSGFTSRLTFI